MMPPHDRSARDLLDFYAEAGVDALVGEEPVNRFAAVEAPAPATRTVRDVVPSPHREANGPAAALVPQALDEAAIAARAGRKAQRRSMSCVAFSKNLMAAL